MRSFLLLAGAALIAANVGRPASDDDAAVRKALDAQYARYIQAEKSRDLAKLMDLLTPDFSYEPFNGQTLNRKQFEGVAKANFERWKRAVSARRVTFDLTIKIDKVAIHGSQAVAIATRQFTTSTPVLHGYSTTARYTFIDQHNWIQTPQGWRLKHTKQLIYRATTEATSADAEKLLK